MAMHKGYHISELSRKQSESSFFDGHSDGYGRYKYIYASKGVPLWPADLEEDCDRQKLHYDTYFLHSDFLWRDHCYTNSPSGYFNTKTEVEVCFQKAIEPQTPIPNIRRDIIKANIAAMREKKVAVPARLSQLEIARLMERPKGVNLQGYSNYINVRLQINFNKCPYRTAATKFKIVWQQKYMQHKKVGEGRRCTTFPVPR